ncbi:hypothetical protein GTN30_02575 [Macrococcoides canis]|uniref:Uncharacterized protein n=1 Tax=Macrococcoides canis TaxID=1855823 RepID=A0AAE6X0P5_9STAP|nr:hypothetical protein [Macrococcus canis]QIH77542.1 hypothetical protein GTN30_02575 [Macrococcus canis]
MNTIDMYLIVDDINKKHPELKYNEESQLILRTLIFTNFALDSVEYITGLSKPQILSVYQKIKSSNFVQLDNDTSVQTLTKPRSFKRIEMVEFIKARLREDNPDIEFINLKYNVLTCKLDEQYFTVYISTSRDYEFLKDEDLVNTKRVTAWHKGAETIFKDYDYYALLVKIDERSTYETDNDKDIEYIFLSKQEMSDWIDRKSRNQSGMVNCYDQYLQDKNSGSLLKVIDSREHPMISLKDFYRRALTVGE